MDEYGNLLEGIDESDIPYEMEVMKTPSDKEVWNRYLDHKKQRMLEETSGGNNTEENFWHIMKFKQATLALYYRQSIAFEHEPEYWNEFVGFYMKMIKSGVAKLLEFNLQRNICVEVLKLFQVYDNLPGKYEGKVLHWKRLSEFIFSLKDNIDQAFILKRFNDILTKVGPEHHVPLWEVFFTDYFRVVEIDLSTQHRIYTAFFVYLKNCHKYDINVQELAENENLPDLDTLFNELLRLVQTPEQLQAFEEVFSTVTTPQNLLKMTESELELYRRYFEKSLEISLKNLEDDHMQKKVLTMSKQVVKKFPDQLSIFKVKYANYLISLGKFDEAIEDLVGVMKSCITLKDFTLAFDFLTEALEKKAVDLSETKGPDDPKVAKLLDKLDSLLSKRLLLLNDVKIRQNRNTPSAWAERIEIIKGTHTMANSQDRKKTRKKLLDCYSEALLSMKASKLPMEERHILPRLWSDYAKLYLEDGDLSKCRTVFETATKVPWTDVEQLEDVWIDWINVEIGQKDLQHAKMVCSAAVKVPAPISSGRVSIDDDDISVHMKLFKSVRLWCLYLDLVENTSDLDETCQAYDDCIELQVVNGVILMNFTIFLEEAGYIEKSFSVFERGLAIFSGESKSIIYGIYLTKVLSYWQKLGWNEERVREVYEGGIDYFRSVAETNSLRQVYISYSSWEAKYGSQSSSLKVLEEGITNMNNQLDKVLLYKLLITATIENRGLEWAVPVFRDALEGLTVQIPEYISEIVAGFVTLELQLGDVSKARSVLHYATENIMEFNEDENDRRAIWDLYKAFELENGNEATYKEMLKRKLYLENIFGRPSTSVGGGDGVSTRESSNLKSFENGVGFEVSTDGPRITNFTAEVGEHSVEVQKEPSLSNGDVIELDMDMDMDV